MKFYPSPKNLTFFIMPCAHALPVKGEKLKIDDRVYIVKLCQIVGYVQYGCQESAIVKLEGEE